MIWLKCGNFGNLVIGYAMTCHCPDAKQCPKSRDLLTLTFECFTAKKPKELEEQSRKVHLPKPEKKAVK